MWCKMSGENADRKYSELAIYTYFPETGSQGAARQNSYSLSRLENQLRKTPAAFQPNSFKAYTFHLSSRSCRLNSFPKSTNACAPNLHGSLPYLSFPPLFSSLHSHHLPSHAIQRHYYLNRKRRYIHKCYVPIQSGLSIIRRVAWGMRRLRQRRRDCSRLRWKRSGHWRLRGYRYVVANQGVSSMSAFC